MYLNQNLDKMEMSERREFEQRYARFWRRLANFLRHNINFPVSGVAREGSRRWSTHRDRSDLDVIFAIRGDPSKREVYPSMIERLRSVMNVQARAGSSYNAVKIQKGPLRCDLVLKSQSQFQAQINSREFEEI